MALKVYKHINCRMNKNEKVNIFIRVGGCNVHYNFIIKYN